MVCVQFPEFMTTPLRARKSPLPRIGALPMLANARQCQPVGRPLLNADGRSASGPDPLGLKPPLGWVPNAMEVDGQPPPPEWNCAICLCRLDGPAEEEEETNISFEATMVRDYVVFMESDSNDNIYSDAVFTMLGYDPNDSNGPIKSIKSHFEYGGPGKTWVRIDIDINRDGRKVMERIVTLARSQEQTFTFFDCPAVVDMASIHDSNEDRYVVEQLEVCGHQFHRTCLKNMLLRDPRASCPECTQYIIKEEVEYLSSDFKAHEAVNPVMKGQIDRYDRLVSGPDALILTDPGYVSGDSRYTDLYTRLVEKLRLIKNGLGALEQTLSLARQKQPGELNANGQRNATWQEMSNFLNPQGNGLPPRQQFPLEIEQERGVVQYIHTLFDGVVEGAAVLFPVRGDGVYPNSHDSPGLDAILSDDALMALVRTHVQSTYTNATTPLTPGNEAIFLNTWKSLKAKAVNTGTALRAKLYNNPDSQELAFTNKLLESTYKRMLAEANLDIQRDANPQNIGVNPVRPRSLSDFDRIARAGQAQVLGTRIFNDYEDLNREISRIRTMHDGLEAVFSTFVMSRKSYLLIDIALRTHPLLDCSTNLLNQTVRFLTARNHDDFRREYQYNKYFLDSGIWDAVLQIIKYSLDTPNICTIYSKQSILGTLLVHTQDNPEAMERSVNGWLELIRPDVVEIYRLSPWRIHWSTEDFFNAVTSAYLIKDSFPSTTATTLFRMLKSMLAEIIRSELQREAMITDE